MFQELSLKADLYQAYKSIQNAQTETSYKATGFVAETAEKAKGTFRGATGEAVNKITLAKEQVISSVTGTAEQAKSSINEMVHTSDSLTNSLTNTIQSEFSHAIHNWLATHPLISWGLDHPLQILGIALFVIFLLRGLFKLIDRLLVDAWMLVIKLPVNFSYFLFKNIKINKIKQGEFDVKKTPKLASNLQGEELANILQKLEVINQE